MSNQLNAAPVTLIIKVWEDEDGEWFEWGYKTGRWSEMEKYLYFTEGVESKLIKREYHSGPVMRGWYYTYEVVDTTPANKPV